MRYKYDEALKVAEEIVDWLYIAYSKIIIAGSLRRKKAEVGDIEILVIPNWDLGGEILETVICDLIVNMKLDYRLNKQGFKTYGKLNKLLVHCESGIPVDIFSTTGEKWATALVVRTGPKESNIRICMEARKLGVKFNAYGSGFSCPDGSKKVCHSEEDVFKTVGLPCQPPEERR